MPNNEFRGDAFEKMLTRLGKEIEDQIEAKNRKIAELAVFRDEAMRLDEEVCRLRAALAPFAAEAKAWPSSTPNDKFIHTSPVSTLTVGDLRQALMVGVSGSEVV